MKNLAILSFLLSLFLVACGDDSSSSADDLNEESEIFSSSSSKANKSSKSSSSSSKKVNNSSNSSSSSSKKANNSSNSSSSSSEKANNSSNSSSSSSKKANNSSNSSSSSSKKAETVPKDVQNWKDTTEGAIRKSDITDTIYIFDNKKWRVATLPEASLGGCNEKKVNFFGYAEERETQDMTDPRVNECIERTHSSECGNDYYPGYYICKKNYSNNTFYWKLLEVDDYFGACTESLLGTIKEVPVIETKTELDYLGDENYIYHSYVISIDSTKKRQYICRHRYSDLEFYEVINYRENRWHIASEIDIELAPKLCDNWWNCNGEIISGKNNNKYVCDFGGFRYATQEEIEAGIACTECMRDRDIEKCNDELETETGMTCAEYKRHIEKCRSNE